MAPGGLMGLAPKVEPCDCVIVRRVMQNVNRGWEGLLDAPRIEDTPLLEVAEEAEDAWITADTNTFRCHLRHAALRMGPDWDFRVVTDSDLMVAWLASAKLEGLAILDPEVAADAAPVSRTKVSLADLITPAETLIIVLGVKAARNAAMPEVLSETLNTRIHERKTVWIVDQPHNRFIEGHRAFDHETQALLTGFSYYSLDSISGGGHTFEDPENLVQQSDSPIGKRTFGLSGGHGGTTTVPVETADPKPKKKKWDGKRGGKS